MTGRQRNEIFESTCFKTQEKQTQTSQFYTAGANSFNYKSNHQDHENSQRIIACVAAGIEKE